MMPTEKAIAMFRSRIRDDSDYQNRTILGRLLLRQAQETGELSLYSDAERVLREAHAISPEHTATRLHLADALCARHEFNEAIRLVSPVLERDKDNLSAIASLGDASLNIGDIEAAEQYYARLSELSQAPAVSARLAHCDELRGKIDSAISNLNNAIDQSARYDLPDSERAWYMWRLGTIYWSQGDWASAKASFKKTIEIVPDHVDAVIGLAQTLAATRDDDDAIHRLTEVVDRTADPPAMALLADLLLLNGDDKQARVWLDKADRAMAEEAKVAAAAHYREYANFLSDHATRPEQALELARKDFKRRPDVYSHDALAWALYHNKEYRLAKDMIEHALALGTRDAKLHFHASLIKAALGNQAAANQHLQTSRSINPMIAQWSNRVLALTGSSLAPATEPVNHNNQTDENETDES
ncbi:tetratricopeptide repeat protein [Stieleria sp.]|uniref:tetratricopeptide repeat protein n=1 Tax=Stieleria sp. TaxID=2795976 RepID=UPI00356AE04F